MNAVFQGMYNDTTQLTYSYFRISILLNIGLVGFLSLMAYQRSWVI